MEEYEPSGEDHYLEPIGILRKIPIWIVGHQ